MINMDGNDWKDKLEQGFAELTPDCWDEIRSSISDESVKGTLFDEDHRKTAQRRIPAILTAAAVFLFAVFLINDANTVSSMLYIDVNPSVCISINNSGKVISISGVNNDGARVADAALKETGNSRDLEKVVSCVIAEIDREGYFSDGTVDALVSLRYSDSEDKTSLDTACETIKEYASTNGMKSNLISQSFAGTETVEKAAAEMGISDGKYEFMSRLVKEGKLERNAMGDMAEKSTAEILDASVPENDKNDKSEEPAPDDGKEEAAKETGSKNEQEQGGESSIKEKKSSEEKTAKKAKDKKPEKEKKEKVKKNNKNKEKNGNNKNKEKKNNNGKKKGN